MSKSDQHENRHWVVTTDTEKCGLCEVCARHCPTGALRTERKDGKLRLLFQSSLCVGCTDGESCQDVCTEHALRREAVDTEGVQAELVTVNEGELIRCVCCGEEFAPRQRLDAVSRRHAAARVERDYCPLCRRTQLVVRFIDEKLLPDAKAEYRAAHDIMRRARKSGD
jgi:Pyruvate/2-oxoacid:ferredoxin oxidoreductase delta subunit